MTRVLRIIAITLGLVAAGALAGGIASVVAIKLSLSMAHDAWSAEAAAASSTLYGWFFDDVVIIALVYGIPFGAIIAPLIAWLLLRHVPIALMFLWCACGTVAGSVIGWITTSGLDDQMSGGLAGALIGCLVGAILLNRRYVPQRLDWRHEPPHHPSRRVHQSPVRGQSRRGLHPLGGR